MAFVTDTGMTVPSVTTDQMREIDRIAIEETGPNLDQMMENAGRNLAALVLERHGEAVGQGVVVLAGTGGNGGGGLAAGRHLANRGIEVSALVTSAERLDGVPRRQLELLLAAAGSIVASPAKPCGVVLDAVIGYSLSGAPYGRAAELVALANDLGEEGAAVVSLDVPSGVDATTGETPGSAVRPDTTMTLDLPKIGLETARSGDLFLADLGIPSAVHVRAGVARHRPIFDERFVIPLQPVEI